jgi:two-component system, NtrC family, sensor kinase
VRVFVELHASRLQVARARDALQLSNVELRALAEAKAALVEDARVANAELERAYAHLQATQNQLVQSAKMGALGELVAGLAHEINNPLSFSIGHLDTALRVFGTVRTTLGEVPPQLDAQWIKASERLTQLGSGLERIKAIVEKLQTFAHFQRSDYEQVSLSTCVEAILAIVRHRLHGRIRVITRFGEPDWLYCFPSLINQGLMSLIQNAIEAIEGEGQICICTGREGEAYVIRITDTGCGIPSEIRDRVFEPFFTTKGIGEGAGLGLSVAYSAARGHGGTLELIDGQGGGTEAIVRMPLDSTCSRGGESKARAAHGRTDDASTGGTEAAATIN